MEYNINRRSLVARTLMPPLLYFTYVYFFESGLFNGLRPIQIKKFPLFGRVQKCLKRFRILFRRQAHESSFIPTKLYERLAQPARICRLQPGPRGENT
jgi:hypothetical protein